MARKAARKRGVGVRAPGQVRHAVFGYYPRLGRVRRLVESSLTHPVSLAEAARVACVSPQYFSTFFRAKVGVGFAQWQRAVRIETAVEILRAENLSLGEVAARVGFGSVRTFERAFKKLIGVTPRQFKAQIRP